MEFAVPHCSECGEFGGCYEGLCVFCHPNAFWKELWLMQRNAKVYRLYHILKDRFDAIEEVERSLDEAVQKAQNQVDNAQIRFDTHTGCLPHVDAKPELSNRVLYLSSKRAELQCTYDYQREMGIDKKELLPIRNEICVLDKALENARFLLHNPSKEHCTMGLCDLRRELQWHFHSLQAAVRHRGWKRLQLSSRFPFADDLQETIVSMVGQWSLAS